MRSSDCLLYTSDAADERSSVDLGGRRIIKKKKKRERRERKRDRENRREQKELAEKDTITCTPTE